MVFGILKVKIFLYRIILVFCLGKKIFFKYDISSRGISGIINIMYGG